MSQVTLSFQLPEQQMQYDRATDGAKLAQCLNLFGSWIKNRNKYTDETHISIHEVKQTLFEIAKDLDVESYV